MSDRLTFRFYPTDTVSVRHRDWYVDEGPIDPMSGFIAVASGAVTNSLSLIFDYAHGLNVAAHKPTTPPKSPSSLSLKQEDPRPDTLRTRSLEYIPSRNPVQKAARFSPEHLDYVALRMASKTLAGVGNKQKAKRTYSWSPVQRTPTLLHKKDEKVHYHGRLHDASVETGHFAYSMGATALRGKSLLLYS